MTRSVTLPAGSVSLTAKVRYDIELDWDYAYLTVNGTPVATNLSTATNPNGQNFGNGITGSSGGTWVDLTADLSAFAGQTVTLGFRYWTDGAVADAGFGVDDIAITGQPVDGAETDAGLDLHRVHPHDRHDHAVVLQRLLRRVPQLPRLRRRPAHRPVQLRLPRRASKQNWVEHFPYQDGLLVWYYDTSFADNNVGDNCLAGRCGGLFLPVDAHPELLIRPDNGKVWRPRIQSYDSTFGLERTDKITLHANAIAQTLRRPAGQPDVRRPRVLLGRPESGHRQHRLVQRPAAGHRHHDSRRQHQRPGRVHAGAL